jgi:hypothetical protein
VREYLVIQEISYGGHLSDARLTKLTDGLLDVENCDGAITDADVAGKLGTGDVEVQMIVTALDPAEAAGKALGAVRAAVHAAGDATPGWETASGMMRIAPAEASERRYAQA